MDAPFRQARRAPYSTEQLKVLPGWQQHSFCRGGVGDATALFCGLQESN